MPRGKLNKNDLVGKAARKRRLTPRKERLPGEVMQVNLRLTGELHGQLVNEAQRNKQSLNQEMLIRLQRSFERDKADELLEEARLHQAVAKRLYEDSIQRTRDYVAMVAKDKGVTVAELLKEFNLDEAEK